MERLLFHTGVSAGVLDLSTELPVLLIGFLAVVWWAAGLIGIMAGQHFLSWTSMALRHIPSPAGDEHRAASCDRRGTGCRGRREEELERGMP